MKNIRFATSIAVIFMFFSYCIPSEAKIFSTANPSYGFLVIDSNNDGLKIRKLDLKEGIYFDWIGDDFAIASDWIGPDDYFLVYYEEGKLKNISGLNLFGGLDRSFEKDLAKHDDDGNRKINGNDKSWSHLHIWSDKNSDGFIQSDEISSLSSFSVDRILLKKNVMILKDGRSMSLIHFLPSIEKQNSRFGGDVEIDFATLFLPKLRGFSKIPDLLIAMSINKNLKSTVLQICTMDAAKIFTGGADSLIDDLHYQWAEVENIEPKSRGPHVDARRLAFQEKYFATIFIDPRTGSKEPTKDQGMNLKNIWNRMILQHKSLIIGQCQGGALLKEKIIYDPSENKLVLKDKELSEESLNSFIGLSDKIAPELKKKYWSEVMSFIFEIYGEDEALQARQKVNSLIDVP